MALNIKLSDLNTVCYKAAVKKMLDARDLIVNKSAPSVLNPAVGQWSAIAPYRTGFTARDLKVIKKNKYVAAIQLIEPYRPAVGTQAPRPQLLVVHTLLHNNAAVKGWYRDVKNNFYNKVKSDFN